jgi:hypothetical protein
MLRKVAAVIAGILVVGVVVATLQMIGTRLHPLPEGVDPMDPVDRDAFRRYLAGLPAAAWLIAFFAELLGAFVGALVTGRISRDGHRVPSGVIICVALIGSVYNWVSFPHPVWFMVGQLVAYPFALLLVWRLLEARRLMVAAQPASG